MPEKKSAPGAGEATGASAGTETIAGGDISQQPHHTANGAGFQEGEQDIEQELAEQYGGALTSPDEIAAKRALLGDARVAPPTDTEPEADALGWLDRGVQPVDLGIISEYAGLMYELAGSSKSYHELGGVCAVAAAIQHRYLPLYFAQRSKLRPNIFGAILGRSSFDHKSTALSKADEAIPYEAMPNCARLAGMFTEEGLYADLAERPFGIVVRDEIGGLFASHRRRYTEFVIPFLTDAFGGYLQGKRLVGSSTAGREVGLTIIGATTYSEFAKAIRDGDWESGWLVRWIYALPDEGYDAARPVRWPEPRDYERLTSLRTRLIELNKEPEGAFLMHPAAHAYLTDWRAGLIREVARTERHERVDAIIERYASYGWKFSMILCAARGDAQQVTERQAVDAARLAENYMTQLYRLYRWQQHNRITGSLLQRAFLFIQRENKEGRQPTKRQVGRVLTIEASLRDKVIERLLDLGAIGQLEQGKTVGLLALVDKLPISRLSDLGTH